MTGEEASTALVTAAEQVARGDIGISPERSPVELSAIANREHKAAVQAASATLLAAVRAGEALAVAREQVPDGEWLRWLEENFEGHPETARTYMRIARLQDTLREHGITGVKAAREFLRGSVTRDPRRDEAHLLHEAGQTFVQIAEAFDLAPSTVQRWFKPRARDRRRATERAARQPETVSVDPDRHAARLVALIGEALETAEKLKGHPAFSPSVKALSAVLRAVQRQVEQGHSDGPKCECAQAVVDDGLCAKCGKAIG